MKTIRLLAGLLLFVTGILHIIVYFQAPDNPGSIGILGFGVIYCITGLLLFNKKKYPIYLGIFVPIVGMTLSLIKFGIPELISMSALFKLLEVIAVGCCIYLLMNKKINHNT
jgi:uncharacterized membrane protein HdeD (DUF308 family)